jgi:hypothetical protein
LTLKQSVVPEQDTEPLGEQVAVAVHADLRVTTGSMEAFWACDEASGAGAKIAARASAAGSAGAAMVGRAQKASTSTVNPRSNLLFISNPP